MRIQQLFEHHGIGRNPFTEEDAQTDPVFKDHCIETTYHPAWDKVYGDPSEPATSVVFGEKGSGKTAIRLQIARHLDDYNRAHPAERLYVIEYDDFNPFLDRFREKLSGRKRRVDRVLEQWKLWDHMDAILTLGVTSLVDRILGASRGSDSTRCEVDESSVSRMDRHQARDLLLLAACYDHSTAQTHSGRWNKLRKQLRFWTIRAHWPALVGIAVSLAVAGLVVGLKMYGRLSWLQVFWIYGTVFSVGWCPWLWHFWKCHWLARGILRHLRVGNVDASTLRRCLMRFTSSELSGQPLPNKQRTDDRYELLAKFQGILSTVGFPGVIVLVDRVDEPHLINGSADMMKALLWPMLDNKFLTQPGFGLKLMLPIELSRYVEREDRDFYQRARLDKQNMIPSLEWTGEALYDVANARIRACTMDGASPSLRDLFDESISERRMIETFGSLRVPRHLFKFLYRLVAAHAGTHTDDQPSWKISGETFESVLAVFNRDQQALDLGLGTG